MTPAASKQSYRGVYSPWLIEKWFEGGDVFPILPNQFFSPQDKSNGKALIMALLDDFVVCIVKDCVKSGNSTRAARLLQEDLEYLTSPETRYLCCFNRCCETLDIDPDYLREGILRKMAAALVSKPQMGELRRHRVPNYGKGRVSVRRKNGPKKATREAA